MQDGHILGRVETYFRQGHANGGIGGAAESADSDFAADQLLDECFDIVERIAKVPPETVKINLQVATLGLDMMGLRDALTYDKQMSAPAHVMLREELRKPLDYARANKGIREYLQMRDGPFQPEPFGPRAKQKPE